MTSRYPIPPNEIELTAVRAQGAVDMERLRQGVQLDDGQAAFERIEPTDPRAAPGSSYKIHQATGEAAVLHYDIGTLKLDAARRERFRKTLAAEFGCRFRDFRRWPPAEDFEFLRRRVRRGWRPSHR